MPMQGSGVWEGIMVALRVVGTPSLTVGGVIPWLGIPHCIERGLAAAGIRSCFLIVEAMWLTASRSYHYVFPTITDCILKM